MTKFLDRLRSAMNVFRDPSIVGNDYPRDIGPATSTPQFQTRTFIGSTRTIINSIYNRISVDASMVRIVHARLNEKNQFSSEIDSGLNRCLTNEANIDQSAKAFIRDGVSTMIQGGHVVLVPVDTSVSIGDANYFDILSMRVGVVKNWYPQHVRVNLYNDRTGLREDITIRKSAVGIIQNPFYETMNEPNGILQRLLAKLSLLDAIDQQSGSGKFNLIIQLPYTLKSDSRKAQAKERIDMIEEQLEGSRHGIAYTDATERVIQLNRALENNLMEQIQFLTKTLYGQLGISEDLLNGKADEKEELNYQNKVIEPIVSAFADEMKRKFLSKTAQTQGQTVIYFRNFFGVVTPERLPDIVDKLSRNKVASPNEFRSVIGLEPSNDPDADKLQNANMPSEQPQNVSKDFASQQEKEKLQNGR